MINYIWSFIIIISIIFSFFNNTTFNLNAGIGNNARDSVETIIVLLTSMCVWQGLLNVADKANIIDKISNKIKPILKILFDTRNEKCLKYISVNMIANMIGLGSCSTPSGLIAMKELNKENENKKLPSHDMCMFLLINVSSLQLVSMTILMYRTSYNSVNPNIIIIPSIIATTITTLVAIIFSLLMKRFGKSDTSKFNDKKIDNRNNENN